MPQFLTHRSEQWFGQAHANKVTGAVWVHPVRDPELFARLAVRIEHCSPQIDELEALLRCDVLLERPIGRNALRRLIPATRTGSDARVDDSHVRQPGLQPCDKRLEIGHQLRQVRPL